MSATARQDYLRLAIVGFGALARDFYIPALRTLDGVSLAAIADPLPESRRAAAAACPGIACYADHRALLESVALDGLLIASPPSTHLAIWRDACASGLAAFVEKPLLLAAQLDELETHAAHPRVMVNFNRRFWPTYARMAALVRDGTLGTPVELEFSLELDVLAWSRVTRHRFDEREGGVLHDLGCHAVDLAVGAVGIEPETIRAEPSTRRRSGDHLLLRLDFPDGSRAKCMLAYGVRTLERLAVRGPAGGARLIEPNAAIHVGDGGAGRRSIIGAAHDALLLAYRALRRSRAIGRASIRAALASFVDASHTGAAFSPGFEDGLRNARWIAAAARSAAANGAAERPSCSSPGV